MAEFRMPSLGADMEAGTLVEWMVKPGDSVTRGQVVAVVETQKGAIEIEIWQSGTVRRLAVAPGEKVPVGSVLALLDGAEEAIERAAPSEAQPAVGVPGGAPAPAPASRRRISPAARRRAEELRLSLESIEAAAPDGVVSIEDVERAARPAQGAALRPRDDWRGEMRKAIAAAMTRSKREIPHYYVQTDIDVTDALAWLAELNASRPLEKRLLPAVLFIAAVARALRRVPGLNGVCPDGAFEPGPSIHLGIAIAMRGGGLVAPALHDADMKDVDGLMAALRDLIERVRSGRLRSSELADPTMTLTSLGENSVDRVTPVIYPPQVAIVGIGQVRQRPWCIEGAVRVRHIVTATLAADHRVSDGHLGARFVAEIERLLTRPETLQKGRP